MARATPAVAVALASLVGTVVGCTPKSVALSVDPSIAPVDGAKVGRGVKTDSTPNSLSLRKIFSYLGSQSQDKVFHQFIDFFRAFPMNPVIGLE